MTDEIEHTVSVMEDFYRDWRRTRSLYLMAMSFLAVGIIIVMTLLLVPAFYHSLSTLLWVPAALVMSMMAGIYTSHYRTESAKKRGVVDDLKPYVMARIESLDASATKKVFEARIKRMD